MKALVVICLALTALTGCSAIQQRSIPAAFDFATAAPYGIPGVWSTNPDRLVSSGSGRLARSGPSIAFSGGGELGAFGAGVLLGWTEHGDRPDFTVATGVSTGAILALYAMLGPEHDADLAAIYSRYDTGDLLRPRPLAALFGAPALNSAQGYRRLIDDYIDQEVLSLLAERHDEGRRLIVVSTDLDREQAVFWDLTAIAASRHPQALTLIRDVVQASSAIPVVFPPVLIPFEDEVGRTYAAMHVDGGTSIEFTLFGLGAGGASRAPVYLVLNQFEEPEPAARQPRLLDIARASTATLIENATMAEVARADDAARAAGVPLRVAVIPDTFMRPSGAEFDRVYMAQLMELGRQMMLEGSLWRSANSLR